MGNPKQSESQSESGGADKFRVARDYALVRLEHLLNLSSGDPLSFEIASSSLPEIESSFHAAQIQVLASTEEINRKHELQVTINFEQVLIQVKRQLHSITTPKLVTKSTVIAAPAPASVIKLPRITLKSFNGQLENWLPFIEMFNSLIHCKQDLSEVEKLHYLISSVEGKPLDLIKGFPITSASYKDAYDTLFRHYNCTRHLAATVYEKLLTCDTVKVSNASELQRLDNIFVEKLAILGKFQLPDKNFMLVHLFWSKLDRTTRELFELEHQSDETPKFESLQAFVRKRFQALSLANPCSLTPTNATRKAVEKNASIVSSNTHKKSCFVNTGPTCAICSESHNIWACPKFLEKDPNSRYNLVKEKNLCINCLSPSHAVKNCHSKSRCSKCNFSHNTTLHFPRTTPETQTSRSETSSHQPVTLACHNFQSPSHVLLSTAQVEVKDRTGNFVKIRVLVDSASETNFLSESCRIRLGLDIVRNRRSVDGIGQSTAAVLGHLSCTMRPVATAPADQIIFDAHVLPVICHDLPTTQIDPSKWDHIQNIKLADPDFASPGPIDGLLGADIFSSSLRPGMIRGDASQPNALNTIFGWVLLGGVRSNIPSSSLSAHLVALHTSLDQSLKRFWEIENIPFPNLKSLSPEETMCENSFIENHSRNEEGRYIVPLPFRNPDLKPLFSGSRALALKRFFSLEKRLDKDPALHKKYVDFIDDYTVSHHLEKVTPPQIDAGNFFYIPHHGILKPESTSTPLRVVFDGSAKDILGASLNSSLLVGEKLQTNIFDLLLRFRWHAVVFTADIKQMYRQILVTPEHTDYQRILWRPTQHEPVLDYRLLTVTYGVTSAPFQALRAVAQLARDGRNQYPAAASILERDLYIDDVVSGSRNLVEALRVRSELNDLFASAGFHLRKWSSNVKDFFTNMDESDLYSKDFHSFDDLDFSLKILGLQWQPNMDYFTFKVSIQDRPCTKRTMLSEVAKVFDPLGILAPTTFLAKYLLQLLWTAGVSWDDTPPSSVVQQWQRYLAELPSLSSLSLPRRIVSDIERFQLHGFCDASERGYCAVVYSRVENDTGEYSVHLVCAKSKVSPLKRITVPRLELCAAVLLSDLIQAVVTTLEPFCRIENITAWSDSTVALTWIKSYPSKWKTFISNRVSHIQDLVPPQCWRHVRSFDNPADCGSRGLLPDALLQHHLWWSGPNWLQKPETTWPQFDSDLASNYVDAVECEQRICTLLSSRNVDFVQHLLNKFSSLRTLVNVLAYCFRFIHNSSRTDSKFIGSLSLPERENTLTFLLKHTQEVSFATELMAISNSRLNSLSKMFRKLSLFLDEGGLLRVGGRLARANIHYDSKHPVLLPRQHRLTFLIIQEHHERHCHPGLQTLHHLLCQQYWILSPKRAIRSVISRCHKCFRANPKLGPSPLMGDLPAYRINQLKSFSSSSVDYAGPFTISLGRYRGAKSYKAYVCLFVCTATKAVHIELASELTTDAFLAALRRLVARRGRVSHLVSDRGTNFVGASNTLKAIMAQAAEQQDIQFKFNPPGSPHFSGLAEAGIKSVKTHLARVIGTQRLTFEEMYTVLTQIESVLNSRPLTPVSSDPTDLCPLTPGHFLTLEPMSSVPAPDVSTFNINRLDRWTLLQRMHQDFWKRFHIEYLHSLQQRMKWGTHHPNLQVGTMVLISDELSPPLKWRVGRIQQLHPGSDGISRVVTVRTASGQMQRPVVKLCPLPLQ